MSTHRTRRPRGYVEAKQIEANLGNDLGFRLIQEEAIDGERIAREREAEEAAARALAEHPTLF